MEVDAELDCRGMKCPLPIIRLATNITDVAVGQTLGVVADDPAARPDAAMGYEAAVSATSGDFAQGGTGA